MSVFKCDDTKYISFSVLHYWLSLIISFSISTQFVLCEDYIPPFCLTHVFVYLQFGFYHDTRCLLLATQVYGAVILIVCIIVGCVQKPHSGGQPLFPELSICLDRVADSCRLEERYV